MSDLLPGLKEALGIVLDANECSDVGDELTMTAEAIQARIDELERAQINADAVPQEPLSAADTLPVIQAVLAGQPAESAPLHPAVQECIDAYGRYYTEHHRLGMNVRNDMMYVAEVATRWAAQNAGAEPATKAAGQDSAGEACGTRDGNSPEVSPPAPAATVPVPRDSWSVVYDGSSYGMLESPSGRIFRVQELGAQGKQWGTAIDNDEICSMLSAAPQITDAQGNKAVEIAEGASLLVAPADGMLPNSSAPASSVPLTEEQIQQIRSAAIQCEHGSIDGEIVVMLCDLALAGLRAKKGTP